MSQSGSSTLLQTIETDLAAGVSYLEKEVEGIGMQLWNGFKQIFIALEPAETQVLIDTLTGAMASAGTGASIEQVETAALNTAKTEEQAVLTKAGSAVVQTVIASLRAAQPAAK